MVTDWAVALMETLGGPGAGLLIAAENLFPPIPSEVVLPLAGFTASRGQLSLVSALVWTIAGSLTGAVILYWLGATLGRDRLRRIVDQAPLLHTRDLDRGEAWFARRGGAAVLIGRFIPVVRSVISVPAGVERMPLPRFLFYTALGSGIWNTTFVLAGYHLGEQWPIVETYVGLYSRVVVVLAAVALLTFVIIRLPRRRTRQPPSR